MSGSSPRNVEQHSQCTRRAKRIGGTIWHHARKHTGVGIVCAVAYFDPGNWGVDLQAGSQFGYKLLFVVLLAGLMAVFLQVLASRLGCVTGIDLASHCRLLLHNRPKHTLLYRWLLLYPLYALSEIAIISTDLAELLGSAIALCMLFPKLPLWGGVLVTAADVIFILALGDPLRGRPVKMFEYLIASLVLAAFTCLIIIIARLHIDWGHVFDGYVPSKYLVSNGALYTSVGVVGATVMPHSLFLGSALAIQDRVSDVKLVRHDTVITMDSTEDVAHISRLRRILRSIKTYIVSIFRAPVVDPDGERPTRHDEVENNSLAFVKAHLYHGVADLVISLLSFAVAINSLILILAAAVFFTGINNTAGPASLFDAHDLIRDLVGKPAALLFALSLLACGQSSSIIATLAGQAVSEGFLQWGVSPVVRRLITRLIGLIPSMVVAIAVGKPGINALLVASQVVLSIILPFVTLPLIYLTSQKSIMSVKKPPTSNPGMRIAMQSISNNVTAPTGSTSPAPSQVAVDSERSDGMVDFSNGKFAIALGAVMWLLILVANVYVIITVAQGKS